MQGIVFYEGPSTLDGKPIVVIATGLERPSPNTKTGPLVQVYILRSDVNPMEAVQTGDDVSICGNCRHRGWIERSPETGLRMNVGRSCYVTLMHGPRVVYEAYKDNFYEVVPLKQAQKILARRQVRVGAYGDPAAVPFGIWEVALAYIDDLTAFTHHWRQFPELSAFCMASCDTEEERLEAKALGFRVYRVRPENGPVLKGEGRCPASDEMNKVVRCIDCMLCNGQRRTFKADITTIVHGSGASHFAKSLA